MKNKKNRPEHWHRETRPLRKVVRELYDHGAEVEELECGHIIHPPSGPWGSSPTSAERRRCWMCRDGLPKGSA